LQAGRGYELDGGIDVEISDKKTVRIPLEADQLVVHSTSEGMALQILNFVHSTAVVCPGMEG